ncbi:hypothetical protein Rhopal_000047-T1 [Rhodotorula paludigena]|uniref:Amino acid transporter transmembrane domain-containing protein n=1 Tax=Rhodotorula paludigena TaxID=86838 RepID=A0AAV5GCN4_9BASI|nr:hypothetical protein Rhopal_000047-T1 [Rhodotorula paludigena]
MGAPTASSLASGSTTTLSKRPEDKEADPEVQQGRMDTIAEGTEVDDVFGAQGGEKTVNYRSMGWIWTTIILCKLQFGLGVLTIPSAFHTLGLAPGLVILVVIAVLTGWTSYEIGVFKLNHPQVYSLADCGELMFGKIGGIVFSVATWLFMVFVGGSGLLSLTTSLNAMSMHATCTAVFVVVSAAVVLPFALLPKLSDIKWVSWVALVSILSAVLLVTIAIPVGGRPALAPPEGPWSADFRAVGNPSFAQAMNAISNLLFSYAGVPVYLPIASEMRNPRDFRKSVIASQTFMTSLYIAIGCVVYYYAGQYVASPALGTAGVMIKRIAYGIAFPGLSFSSIIFTHLSGKFIFVRVLRGSYHLNHYTKTHWLVWFACVFGCLLFSYIIASAIPVFGGLVGLIGALFGTSMSLHAEAFMWLYDLRPKFKVREDRTRLMWLGIAGNVVILLIATFLMVGGMYGSILGIRDDYAASGGRPWSCADNSGSV